MSSRKNRSPEEQARRAKIRELLQESNISSMEDIVFWNYKDYIFARNTKCTIWFSAGSLDCHCKYLSVMEKLLAYFHQVMKFIVAYTYCNDSFFF